MDNFDFDSAVEGSPRRSQPRGWWRSDAIKSPVPASARMT